MEMTIFSGGGTEAGELDILFGGQLLSNGQVLSETIVGRPADSDTFVIGTTGFLYGGGTGNVIVIGGTNYFGQGDRAIIRDFQNGVDKIQTPLGVTPATTIIGTDRFLLAAVTGGFEIIAQVVGFGGTAFAPGTFVAPPPAPV
jgi:hypothetical protein